MFKLNYHHWEALISKGIQNITDSDINHVSIEVCGFIYEAHIHTGVRKVAIEDWDNSTIYKVQEFDCSPKRMANAVAFLEKQVWKKYDTWWALSFIWVFLRQKKGKWYCSELAFVFLMKCFWILSCEYNQRKTPKDVYEIGNIIKHFFLPIDVMNKCETSTLYMK